MKTVAVAEDEPITRMDICAMLEELGFSVAGEASDGFDAIELCRRTRPDVILMDAKMPIFDGLAAAETICREELAQSNVILSTLMGGVSGSANADAAMECKMLVPEMERRGFSKAFLRRSPQPHPPLRLSFLPKLT